MPLVASGYFSESFDLFRRLGPWFVKAWSLELLAIDPDLGTEALPVVTHDLELSCDGQDLAGCRVTYFYCKLFHISFIVSAGPELPPRTGNDLTNLSSGKSLNELRLHPIISGTGCQAWGLELVACSFFLS